MEKFTFTIRDVLARSSFADARLVAGNSGLDREVKWSHVLEVQDLDSLINGGELILTTGVGLQLDVPTQLRYVKKLIDRQVACLCIEIGPYFDEIPAEIIALADEQAFPLIIFEKKVRFVDITQDLHTYIINQHHQMLSQLDSLSRKFNSLSLTHNGILKILQELHHFFKQNVFFIAEESKIYYYPSESKTWESAIRKEMEDAPGNYNEQQQLHVDGQPFALLPVEALGQGLGHLFLQLSPNDQVEFTFLLLDRAALAIAQILLRERTMEERKQNNEEDFVRKLVSGRQVEEDDVQRFLPSPSKNMYYRVFYIRLENGDAETHTGNWEETKLQRLMSMRALFKRCGFFPALSCGKNKVIAITPFLADSKMKDEKNRPLLAASRIEEWCENLISESNGYSFGISSVHQDISLAPKVYEEAKKAEKMNRLGVTESPFYEDLGLYQLLLEIGDQEFLIAYANNHLAPVLEYDHKMDSNLFETLVSFLESNGSKKETADQLFIVRQTLYHRLEKLETLLGKDFMVPSKRLALESAVKVYKIFA